VPLEELAADAGTGDAPGGADQVVARLDPASRAREGQQLRLWFDPSELHLFNPDNGAHLTLWVRTAAPAGRAGRSPGRPAGWPGR
jgi:hypothetical protein